MRRSSFLTKLDSFFSVGLALLTLFVFTVAKPNSFIYEAISAPAAIIKYSSPGGLHWRRSQY